MDPVVFWAPDGRPDQNTLSVKNKSAKSDLIFGLWQKFDRLKIKNPLFSIVIIDDWLNFRPTKNQADYFFRPTIFYR